MQHSSLMSIDFFLLFFEIKTLLASKSIVKLQHTTTKILMSVFTFCWRIVFAVACTGEAVICFSIIIINESGKQMKRKQKRMDTKVRNAKCNLE